MRMQDGLEEQDLPPDVSLQWVKRPLGSVRVSLGYLSTFEDVEAFCLFLQSKYVDRAAVS
jgi:selenocysteine lyase/cysteine desulfurase